MRSRPSLDSHGQLDGCCARHVSSGGQNDLSTRKVMEQGRAARRIEFGKYVIEKQKRSLPEDVGQMAVSGQPQRQRQRALLSL